MRAVHSQAPTASIPRPSTCLGQLTLLETNLKHSLDLGRGGELRRADCSLTALVHETVELVRPRCRHAGITLHWQPPNDPCNLSGDAGQLGQLILNLIGNAIEAAGGGRWKSPCAARRARTQ